MTDDTRDHTEPAPPPHDDEDTDRGGHRVGDALRELSMAPEAITAAMSALGASVEGMREDMRLLIGTANLALGQVRTLAERVGEIERRLSVLPSPLPCQRGDCPAKTAAE